MRSCLEPDIDPLKLSCNGGLAKNTCDELLDSFFSATTVLWLILRKKRRTRKRKKRLLQQR